MPAYKVLTDRGYVEYARWCGNCCECVGFGPTGSMFSHERKEAIATLLKSKDIKYRIITINN